MNGLMWVIDQLGQEIMKRDMQVAGLRAENATLTARVGELSAQLESLTADKQKEGQ